MSGLVSRQAQPAPASLLFAIACNEPDNGFFAGRAQQIEVGDVLTLEPRRTAPILTQRPGAIRLVRRWWPVVASTEYLGNWCWNGYRLPWRYGVDLLVALHDSGLFDCTEGETRLYTLWGWRDLQRPLFVAALRDALTASA